MANRREDELAQPVLSENQNPAAATDPNARPTYAGTFDDQLQEIFQRIQNREPFQYDVNADPLYQAAKDQYIQGGKLAMRDTMGKAAALTGGYGSTYGQQVGQQAFDAYLQDLTGVIPELYDMAYGMYKDKGNDMLTEYGLLGDMRDTEYGRYRDQLSDWNYDQEVARQKEETEYNRRIDEEKTAYSRQQQAYSNLVALIKMSGYNPTDAELAAAGLTREAANAIAAEYTRSITPQTTAASGSGGGGGRSGGGGGGGGYRSGSDIAELQRQLNAMGENLDVDGILGPLTQAAAARHGISIGSGTYTGNAGSGNTGGTNTSGDRTVTDPNGKQQTINQYGEVRTGNNPTRGEVQRAADAALAAGEITYAEYRTIISGIH